MDSFFPNEKGQLQKPPHNLSNIENSHNCHSTYFRNVKIKKRFCYSSVFALKIYSD